VDRWMKRFWNLSDFALKHSLLTADEINAVWDRPRKRGYWRKHYRVLQAMVDLAVEKRKDNPLYGYGRR
jgi:hypothetical protein